MVREGGVSREKGRKEFSRVREVSRGKGEEGFPEGTVND